MLRRNVCPFQAERAAEGSAQRHVRKVCDEPYCTWRCGGLHALLDSGCEGFLERLRR